MICTWYLAKIPLMIFQNCLKFHLTAREITFNNFEISLVIFMPNISTNHAITYTNFYEWENRLLITRETNKLFIYSQFYYYNPNKTDYQIYMQFSTACCCYTVIYNSKLHSLVISFIIITHIKEPAWFCLAKQVLLFLGIKVAKFCFRYRDTH